MPSFEGVSNLRLRRPLATLVLVVTLLTAALPALPVRAEGETTWEKGAAISGHASDILSAANLQDDMVQAGGEYLGYALMGVAIGDAWSAIADGDVEGGLSTLANLAGETAIGLTSGGPVYALGKLLSETTTAIVEGSLGYLNEARYQDYKALRSKSILENVQSRKLTDFVAWAKAGRPTFNQFASTWIYDGSARVQYINTMQEERRSKYSLAQRTGFQLYPFSEAARKYQADMAYVPTEAEIKDFIFAEWEGRVVTEVLQEVARLKLEQARQDAANTRIFITATVTDQSGAPVSQSDLSVLDSGGLQILTPALSVQAEGLTSGNQVAFAAPLSLVTAVSGQETLRLTWNRGGTDVTATTFTLDDLLRKKGPAYRRSGLIYVQRDLGALKVVLPGTTVTVQPTGASATNLTIDGLDPLLKLVSQGVDAATGLLTAQFEGPSGRSGLAVVRGYDRGASVWRSRPVTITLTGGSSSVTADFTPREASPGASTLEGVYAAMASNKTALLNNHLSWSEYREAQDVLVTRYGGLKDATGAAIRDRLQARADSLETDLRNEALSEDQAYRANVDYYISQVAAVKAQADREIAAVKDPADYLEQGGWLYPVKRRLELFDTYASRYERFLDGRKADLAKVASLRDEFGRATESARAKWALLQIYDTTDAALQKAFKDLEAMLAKYETQRKSGHVTALRQRKTPLEDARDRLARKAVTRLQAVGDLGAEVDRRSATLESLLGRVQTWKAAGLMADLEKVQQTLMSLQKEPDSFAHRQVIEASQALDRVNRLLGQTVNLSDEAKVEGSVPGLLERLEPWMAFATKLEAAVDGGIVAKTEDLAVAGYDTDLFNAIAAAADFGGEEDGFSLQVDVRARVAAYVRPIVDKGAAFDTRRQQEMGWPRSNGIAMEQGSALFKAQAAILKRLETQKADPGSQAYAVEFGELDQAGAGLAGRMAAPAIAPLNATMEALAQLHNRLQMSWRDSYATPDVDRLVQHYGDELWGQTLPAWLNAQTGAWQALNKELTQLNDSFSPFWGRTPEERNRQLGLWAGRLEELRQAEKLYSRFSDANIPAFLDISFRYRTVLQAAWDRLSPAQAAGEKLWKDAVGDFVNKPQPIHAGGLLEFQLGSRAATLNGTPASLDVQPPVRNGRTMVPLRMLGEAMGALVTWDGTERKVTYRMGASQVELWVGKGIARVNARDVTIDPAPEIIGGRTYVPLRFVTEALGATVNYDAATRGITIEYGK